MKNKCFTLMELLCVMMVLAILAAMLLPALGKAQRTAASVSCTGNLRQIGVAFLLYSSDNKMRLPGGGSARSQALSYAGKNWAWMLFPYYNEPRLLDCPSSPDGVPEPTHESLHLYDGNFGWNFKGTGGQRGPASALIPSPSQAYLVFDCGDQCVIEKDTHSWSNLLEELDLDWEAGQEAPFRHDAHANVCHLDGHISPYRLHSFLATPNPSNTVPWFIQWSNGCLEYGTITHTSQPD